MRGRPLITLGWLAAVAGLLIGCTGGPGILSVKAEYPIGKRKLLVVPFKDPAFSYFESKNGCELADGIAGFMRIYHRRVNVISGTELRSSIKERDYTKLPLSDAAREIGADTVLEGSIIELETRDPKAVNLMRGKITVEFALHDVEKWDPPLYSKRETYFYPKDTEYEHLLSQDVKPKQVLDELLSLCAQRIAECFVDHEELKE